MSYTDANNNGFIAVSEVVEGSDYYPFGLKHSKIMDVLSSFGNSTAQKYKYQGQERQDELGLNWDSFKWRNYDYAIGRFMSIDPLAEKYVYNSTYAFQENKMGMGVELEGLEMVSERSKDGKSVTLTMKVRAVNNTNSISKEQFNSLVTTRMENTAKVLSGSIGGGVTVNATVVLDPKATLVMEYNDGLHAEGVRSLEGVSPELIEQTLFQAIGVTNENGNTQENGTQVNVPRNVEFDANGMPVLDQKNVDYITNTGTHEDLHQLGLTHVPDVKNIMHRENTGGTVITPEQRKSIVEKTEEQQPR